MQKFKCLVEKARKFFINNLINKKLIKLKMKTRFLRDIKVSEIGMGCMGLSHGYGEIPDEAYSIAAIQKAYDFGCTFFDTAEGYGAQLYTPGHNERILGKAVKDFRDKVVLATKFHFMGDKPKGDDEIEAYMRRHLSKSLENLKTNYVDLYYLHRVSRDVPLETVAAIMGKFIKEGVIRGWGLSQVNAETLAKANAVTPVSTVQNIYNMLERDCEKDIFPFCLKNNIGVVPFSPVASGFLSGKITDKTDFSHADDVRKFVPQLSKENFNANMPVLELVNKYAVKKNATKAQIALAWMLAKYANVVPIPGSKNQERILENLGACNVELSDKEFLELDAALDLIKIHGHRGQVEYDGMSMKDWNR